MGSRKKILIHSIVFSPDGVSTAYLYNDIALAFRDAGYEVTVLTTTPHYNVLSDSLKNQPLKKKAFGFYYTSNYKGITVRHVPQKKFKSTFLRIIGFVYWHVVSLILGLSERKVEVILSPSPPLTIGFLNLIIGKLKGAKVIYNVQEIYPDFLIEQGGLRSKPAISVLKWLEKFVYNHSDVVTTIDQIFYNTIAPRFRDPSKLHIIPNFVDTELYRPFAADETSLDPQVFKQNDSLKLMYAGNIGFAQDWEPMLEVAKQVKGEKIEFYIIGEGVAKESLQQKVLELGLDQVYILPYQPRELMPQLLAFADLQFIFMSKEMEGHGFPSKVYTIMACAKPLLVCSGHDTPIANFLRPIGNSKLITVTDLDQKVDQIVEFLKSVDQKQLASVGRKGFEEVQSKYSTKSVTQKYINLVHQLLS